MTKSKALDRIADIVRQQKQNLCVEVRKDKHIIIFHLDNGQREAIRLTPEEFETMYQSLANQGTSIPKPEHLE